MRTRIKICCMANESEMRMAVECGVDAIGLVSSMPSGPGVITDEQIAHITARVPPPVASFLLTSRQDAGSIIAQQKQLRTNTLQLVDSVPTAEYARLRDALPGISLVPSGLLPSRRPFRLRLTSMRSCWTPAIPSWM